MGKRKKKVLTNVETFSAMGWSSSYTRISLRDNERRGWYSAEKGRQTKREREWARGRE